MHTIVIGTIGSDAHVTGQFVIARTLQDAGFKVIRLGACVPQDEFIEAAIESAASAILVSSLYGMGYFDCQGLREKCIEAGIGDIVLYVGGLLVSNREPFEETRQRFEQIGFNRAYPPETRPSELIVDLRNDLGPR